MILDAAETVLAYFGFDRTLYGNKKNLQMRKWRWFEELRHDRERDINIEMFGNPHAIILLESLIFMLIL